MKRMEKHCSGLLAGLVCVLIGTGGYAAETAGKGFPIRSANSAQPVVSTVVASQQNPGAALPAEASVAPQNTPVQTFEAQPLAFPSAERRARSGGERREFSTPSILPALFSVFAVCTVFCVILYLVKKYLPGHKQLFTHPAMEVLGRTHLDPKRYVSLLRVGKRIVVVGVSPDEMRPLSEITDEEEITCIMEVARPKTEAGLTLFQKLFQRTVVDTDAEEARLTAQAHAETIGEQLSSLRKRVQEIHTIEEKPARRQVDRVG